MCTHPRDKGCHSSRSPCPLRSSRQSRRQILWGIGSQGSTLQLYNIVYTAVTTRNYSFYTVPHRKKSIRLIPFQVPSDPYLHATKLMYSERCLDIPQNSPCAHAHKKHVFISFSPFLVRWVSLDGGGEGNILLIAETCGWHFFLGVRV